MNSYVGMTMVKKEQGQDDYFNQQSILSHITSLHKCYIRGLVLAGNVRSTCFVD